MQSLVNLNLRRRRRAGLYFLGVPYPLLGGAGRGAALHPVRRARGRRRRADPRQPGRAQRLDGPLWVVGLFVVLELFTNFVLETVLYAGAAGVSQVALLVSVAFWTWLWGPLGLLLATPLTVCLVVLGKHVPGLEFLGTLMADTPALAPENGYYQRLLARDQSEAADLIERHIKTEPPCSVYDALLLPALNYAERDRLEERLSTDEEAAVIDATRELLSDAADRSGACTGAARTARGSLTSRAARTAARARLRHQWRRRRSRAHDARPAGRPAGHRRGDRTRLMASELVSLVQARGVSIVCLADLPPSPPSKTRYLVKRLRAALPECGSSSDAGPRRRWPTRAHKRSGCGCDARGLDAYRDQDLPGGPRGSVR